MTITKKDVENFAGLARLGLDEGEKEKFARELSSVLKYIDKLAELNVEKIEPMSGGTSNESVLRKDDETGDIATAEMKGSILDAAPDRSGDYFKVPSIFD